MQAVEQMAAGTVQQYISFHWDFVLTISLTKHSFFFPFSSLHHETANALFSFYFFPQLPRSRKSPSSDVKHSGAFSPLLCLSNSKYLLQAAGFHLPQPQLLWNNAVWSYEHLSRCHIPTLIQCTNNHNGIGSFVTRKISRPFLPTIGSYNLGQMSTLGKWKQEVFTQMKGRRRRTYPSPSFPPFSQHLQLLHLNIMYILHG